MAQATRAIERPRAFRTAWPRFVDEGVASRNLVVLHRSLIEYVPDGWTCPQEPAEEVPCVSRAEHPEPLVRRLPALERFAGALGGATVGLSLALALVGASVLGWGPAVAVAVPVMTAVGALASASGIGRAIGGAALAAVPLMAVAGARVEWIAGLVALGSAAVVAAMGLGRTPLSGRA